MSALSTTIYNTEQPKTQIYYSNAYPGYGKSEYAINLMITTKAKWLYVVDRIDAMSDRSSRIANKNSSVFVNRIDTDNVAERILFWHQSQFSDIDHQILIITHKGLMISDLSQYKGWSIIIDEVFDPFMSETVCSEINGDMLDQFFAINDGWLSIKKEANISGLYKDTTIDDSVRQMYNAAKNGETAINTDTFSTKKEWNWYSIWNFKNLEVFDSIYVFANSFENSMMAKMMTLANCELVPITLPKRSYTARTVNIRYFDSYNRASQSLFKSVEGISALKLLTAYYAKQPGGRIWTKNNEDMRDLNISGIKLSPCVAGSNAYSKHTKATIIFKSKPRPHEEAILKKFNVTRDELIRAREIETIIQFVTRTAIRNPEDSKTCDFDVYDIDQANALKSYLDDLNIGLKVNLIYEDIGIQQRSLKAIGRPATGNAATAAERMAAMRQRRKEMVAIRNNLNRLNGKE
jgi:hypothetical protein